MKSNYKIIINTLNEHGYQAYLVGGAVRDKLLNKELNDIDITTNAKPDEVIAIFKNKYKVIKTGIKYGTVTVYINKTKYEVTTYRQDLEYINHRFPMIKYSISIYDDLKRRDFTINAIAYHPNEGYIDPFKGITDLNNKIIKCIGNPLDRFCEDSLRILRCIRFKAQLNFEIDKDTSLSISKNTSLLDSLSIERINQEISKILVCDYPDNVLTEYNYIFEKYFGLYNQNISKINNILPYRLALLLFDNENIESILKKLKYSKKIIKQVTMIINYKSLNFKSKIELKRLLNTIEIDNTLFIIDFYSQLHDYNYQILINEIINNNELYSIKQINFKAIDIINMDIKPYRINYIFNELFELIINNKIENNYNSIKQYLLENNFM